MTHGDKAKAKIGKSSQASGKKSGKAGTAGGKSGSEARGKASGKSSREGRASKKSGRETGGEKAAGSKRSTSAEVAPAAGKQKGRSSSDDATFANADIAGAYKHAVASYPNAFRRLSD